MLAFAIVVVLLLIVLNGLLSMTELAVVSSRKSKLQSRAERGDKGARRALKLADEPTHFLSAVQVGITLIGILAGAYGQQAIAGELTTMLGASAPALAPYAHIISTALVVVLITYFSLIIGELVPKRLALIFPEAIASKMAGPIGSTLRQTSVSATSGYSGTFTMEGKGCMFQSVSTLKRRRAISSR